jgi:arsenate reductase
MKNAKNTAPGRLRPTKTRNSLAQKEGIKGPATVRAHARSTSASIRVAVESTVSPATGGGAEHLVARSIFGQMGEFHRPRLVLFVGTPASSYAPVAALWFAALAAESKATIVLGYAGDAPPLAPEMMAALSENGIDTRRVIPRALTPELLAAADLVVTLSSGRQSRVKLPLTTRRREHWTIPDPAAASAKARARAGRKRAGTGNAQSARTRAEAVKKDALLDARSIRDALRARVAMLVFSEGWGRPEISREDARVTRAKSLVRAFDQDAPRPFAAEANGLELGFIAEATPAWFASPGLSPNSLR